MAKNTQKKKSNIIPVSGYYRTSYGQKHWVRKHTRGHRQSIHLKDDPRKYRTAGKTHMYNSQADRKRHAKNKRKFGKAHWRGDIEDGLI